MNTPGPRPATFLFSLSLFLLPGPLLAHDADHTALETRVARLEALIEQLTGEATPTQATAPTSAEPQSSSSRYEFGGYIKFDAMLSDYGGGDLPPGSPGTQFYIPAAIPAGDAAAESPGTDIQGRESRINFRSEHVLNGGDKLRTFLEMDFFVSPGGNERVSNSFNPRLRHAYFRYNDWLFGQTWSNFQDVSALPENLDFIGPAESTTFVRQAQIRYSHGPWQFSIENPETTITPFGGGTRVVADDGSTPDFAGSYFANLANGHIRAALLFRELSCTDIGIDDTERAFGLSVAGKHIFGDDDVRWMATIGRGTGRYLGLNTADDAVLDSNGKLQAIDQWGAFVSLRHFWNSKWRSNLTFGYLNNEHDTALTGTDVTKDVYSVHVNLLYEPVPRMTVGGELLYAKRALETDATGDMLRTILSAKYVF